ncbi:MAG: hypothetical protein LKK13_02490 [Bacilli bacterium]|nr:hypothetical protein [Bacilli bacterium]
MKRFPSGLLLLSALLLAGCQGSSVSSAPAPQELNTLSALGELQRPDANFQVTVKTQNGSLNSSFVHYYAKDYFLGDSQKGYLNENGGVSSFTYEDETLSRSELLSDDEGKGYTDYHQIIATFDDLDVSSLAMSDSGEVDFSKNKKNLLSLFEMMGLSPDGLFTLTSLTAAYPAEQTTPNGLTFTASFGEGDAETTSVLSVDRYGEVDFPYLDQVLTDHLPPFAPTEAEKRIRDLFALKNYIASNDLDGDNTIDQYYYFMPQYFYTDFTPAYAAKDPETAGTYGKRGYIAINNKVLIVDSTSLVFIGTYLFYNIDGDFQIVTREDPNSPGYAQSSFTQIYTDVSVVMNYPTYMTCVNEFQKATTLDDGDIKFVDKEIMADFATNHGYSDMIKDNHLTTSYLLITPNLADEDSDCTIRFQLHFTNGSYLETQYSDFGNGNVGFVDKAIADYGLAD